MEKVCCVRQGEWEQKMEKYYMFEWNPDELFPLHPPMEITDKGNNSCYPIFRLQQCFLDMAQQESSSARNFVYIFRVCVLSKETVSKLRMESFLAVC